MRGSRRSRGGRCNVSREGNKLTRIDLEIRSGRNRKALHGDDLEGERLRLRGRRPSQCRQRSRDTREAERAHKGSAVLLGKRVLELALLGLFELNSAQVLIAIGDEVQRFAVDA